MADMMKTGRVASLHLHPVEPGEPFRQVESMVLVAGKGIEGNPRYFGRVSRSTGLPSKRQVTLIEREQIAEHAATLGLQTVAPGAVRSNIETLNVNLVEMVGQHVQIGDAVLFLYEARTPCEKMDRICHGLRALMEGSRQGVLAQVIRGGQIKAGDTIKLVENL